MTIRRLLLLRTPSDQSLDRLIAAAPPLISLAIVVVSAFRWSMFIFVFVLTFTAYGVLCACSKIDRFGRGVFVISVQNIHLHIK